MAVTEHLAPGELVDLSLGLLGVERRRALEEHLADCESCQTVAVSELRGDEAPSADQPMQLGRFAVRRVLGAGAMGLVFEAYDPRLDRTVAVKLRRGAGTSGDEDRLLDEARAMARLVSPHIVSVYEVGHEADVDFLVIEFVDGTTLRQVLERRELTDVALLELVVQAGHGLAAAHRAGVIHRDFKPENVLIDASSRARVTDFGLAAFAPRTGVTGTPAYLAPELHRGAPATVASDQYSFCVTAYEAVTGHRPTRQKPAWPSGVSARARAAITRGLSPDPADRFPSMEALLHELAPRRQRTAVFGLGLLLGLTALVGGGVFWTIETRHTCRGAEVLVGEVWNDAVRARAEAAFLSTRAPYARDSWALTSQALETWAGRWAAARTDACAATRVRGEQTERQQLLRFECLDRRLTEFADLVATFADADGELVASARTAVANLSALETCANVKRLEDRRAPPPELAETARAIAEQIARGRAQLGAGRAQAARGLFEDASHRARELGLSSLDADALEGLGELLSFERRFLDARERFEAAAEAAEAAGDDATAARVLARLVSVTGWRLERADEARTIAHLARGLVKRLGGDPLIEARLEEGLADTAWSADEQDVSLAGYRRSLGLYEQAPSETAVDVARVRFSIGWGLAELGQLTEARAELAQVRALQERLLGATHPSLASTWNALSAAATEQRDYQTALAELRRGLALSVETPQQAPSFAIAQASLLGYLGQPEEGLALIDSVTASSHEPARAPAMLRARLRNLNALGRTQEAWAQGQAALEEAKTSQSPKQVAYLCGVMAEVAFARRRWADTVSFGACARRRQDALGVTPTPRDGELLLLMAKAHLEMNAPKLAKPFAQRALDALVKGHPDLRTFADARLTLALALRGDESEPARVASLLAEASVEANAAADSALAAKIARARALTP